MDENVSCYLKTLQIREILIDLDPRICSYKLPTEGIYTLSKIYDWNKRAASLCKVFFVTFSYRLKIKLYCMAPMRVSYLFMSAQVKAYSYRRAVVTLLWELANLLPQRSRRWNITHIRNSCLGLANWSLSTSEMQTDWPLVYYLVQSWRGSEQSAEECVHASNTRLLVTGTRDPPNECKSGCKDMPWHLMLPQAASW